MSVDHIRKIVQAKVDHYLYLKRIDPDFQMSRDELQEMLNYAIILLNDLHETLQETTRQLEAGEYSTVGELVDPPRC